MVGFTTYKSYLIFLISPPKAQTLAPKANIANTTQAYKTCGRGRNDKWTSEGRTYKIGLYRKTAIIAAKFLCDIIAPFGGPVVPLV